MSKIIKLNNISKLKKIRDSAWNKNAALWNEKRQLPIDLKNLIYQHLECFLNNDTLVLDVGCGNGWIVDFLFKEKKQNTNYLGLDINQIFIDLNIKKYKNIPHVSFQQVDFETEIEHLSNIKYSKKIFISCLSLIEMVELETVFSNISKNMNKSDVFILVVLNPLFEIFRLSEHITEFKKNIIDYYDNYLCYYAKEITYQNNDVSNSKYVGILHDLNKYHFLANKNNLILNSQKIINDYKKKYNKGTIYHVFKYEKL